MTCVIKKNSSQKNDGKSDKKIGMHAHIYIQHNILNMNTTTIKDNNYSGQPWHKKLYDGRKRQKGIP